MPLISPRRSAKPPQVSDDRTRGEIAARTGMLTVACSRCERRGRYRLDTLITRHGADAGMHVIVPGLVAACPRWESAALVERCEILFPELRDLFRAR